MFDQSPSWVVISILQSLLYDIVLQVGPLLAMTGYLPDQIEVLSILEEYETQQRNRVDTSSYWDIEYSKLSKSQQMHLNRMLLLFQNDRDWTKNVVMRAFHELRGAQKEYPPRS